MGSTSILFEEALLGDGGLALDKEEAKADGAVGEGLIGRMWGD